MTTQVMQPPVQTIQLADPNYPMVSRVISDPLFPDSKEVTWVVGSPHPLIPDLKVVRMFVDSGGVEIYSVSSDNRAGMRNLVPMAHVRLAEEVMPLTVFAEELQAAEEEGNEPDEPEPEPEPEPAPVANAPVAP